MPIAMKVLLVSVGLCGAASADNADVSASDPMVAKGDDLQD